MKIKTKHKRKKSKAFTIIVVPGSKQKTRSIKIPRWIFVPLILLIAAGSYTVGRMHNDIGSLSSEITSKDATILDYSEQLDSTSDNVSKLEDNLKTYNERVKSLFTASSSLDQRTSQLAILNKRIIEEIGDLIGLEIDEEVNEEPSSRSGVRPDIKSVFPEDASFEQNYVTAAKQLVDTDLFICSLEETTAELSSKLDEMKSYLSAYPSILPVQGKFTSYVGYRTNPITRRGREFHSGLDIKVARGTNVKATGCARVTFSGYKSGYGYLVVLDHGFGIETYYAHNSRLLVKKGDWVERGHTIAKSGNSGRSTGPHVHYEIRINDVVKDPLDMILK